MVDALYFAAKALHVALAAAWVGGGLFHLFVVQPAVAKASPAARQESTTRLLTALFKFNNLLGLLVLASGALVVGLHPIGWAGLTTTLWGRLVMFAVIGNAAALYLSATSIRAVMKAIGKAIADMRPGDEAPASLRFLQARLRVSVFLVNGIILLVLVTMVLANAVYGGP